MAEFCPDCFLEFNPNLSKNDLATVETLHLCEGCGKMVDEIVLYVIERKIHMTLEEKITQLETELEKVKAELAESKRTVWKPKDKDRFYYNSGDGWVSIKTFTESVCDDELMYMNNAFEYTPATCQHLKWYNENVLRVQNKLMQLHELLCPDYFPDWNNHDESKYNIYYGTLSKKWYWDAYSSMNMQVVVFTKEAAERACEILNAEKFMMEVDINANK